MGSGRSIIYLPATKKRQDKRRGKKKTTRSAVSEKLNYASESTIIRTRFSRETENVDTTLFLKDW